MRFGDRLKFLRLRNGLTQLQLGLELGYTTPQFVHNWELSRSYPPMKTLRRLAKLYNVEATLLFEYLLAERTAKLKTQLQARFDASLEV